MAGVLVLLVAGGGVLVGRAAFHLSAVHGRGLGRSSSPRTKASGRPAVGSGYLETDPSDAAFIQWNDTNGKLDGTLQLVSVSGQPPNASTSSTSLVVKGSITGSTISLSFDGSALQFGTLSGGSFTINIPQSDGTLAGLTFAASSATSFNQAVAKLQSDVDQANQTAANAQALAQEEQTIENAAATVSQDLQALPQLEANAESAAQGIAPALQTEAADLGTTQQAEQQVAAESGSAPEGQVCGDAAAVSGDAAAVSGDAASVEGDAQVVAGDLSGSFDGLRPAIAQINSDFAQLLQDESDLPGFTVAGAPTQTQVSKAVAAANAVVQSLLATANGDISQANADVTNAYQIAAEAYQAGGCGNAPTAPTPEQAIS